MANIINNCLMCFGKKEDLEVLKNLLQDKTKAIPILSQDIFGIYSPKNIRNFDNPEFGKFPDGFSDQVSVWDVGFWKEQIMNYDFKKNDSQGFSDLIYVWGDDIQPEDECLIFGFQSKYSEPDKGFKALSKIHSKLSFYWFCYGEYDDIVYKEFHFKNGEPTYEESE